MRPVVVLALLLGARVFADDDLAPPSNQYVEADCYFDELPALPVNRRRYPVTEPYEQVEDELKRHVKALKRGDESAWRPFLSHAWPIVDNHLRSRRVVSEADRLDIFQEVSLNLLNLRNQLDPERSITSLIFAIAERRRLDRASLAYNRRTKTGEELTSDTRQKDKRSHAYPDRAVTDADLKVAYDHLAAVLVDSAPRLRFVLHRYHFEGKSQAEIAEELGTEVARISDAVFRIKELLAKEVNQRKLRELDDPRLPTNQLPSYLYTSMVEAETKMGDYAKQLQGVISRFSAGQRRVISTWILSDTTKEPDGREDRAVFRKALDRLSRVPAPALAPARYPDLKLALKNWVGPLLERKRQLP